MPKAAVMWRGIVDAKGRSQIENNLESARVIGTEWQSQKQASEWVRINFWESSHESSMK